ncbi:hypothetical protein KHA76_002479 [Salmonella enterica subsp. houtenae serovar 44:z36,[z38]:-]|nr:hypothetical protein [Salmonella enterica]EHM8758126.1 hypothetical protein [Salmonella enterica subsp. houtenae serovar 44:z36,[z38]:-]HCM1938538.1 hypothetical protein [Salmonella enterica subsp. houtenae serovar 57:z4,z23:-]HCM6269339.1 hypothetical protein [Salmonella enterica subsp. houtenae serovar 44:z36,Z38:-]EGF3878587.1 hypothetical protein [Salmonella enterica]
MPLLRASSATLTSGCRDFSTMANLNSMESLARGYHYDRVIRFWFIPSWQLLKKARHFMETVSPFPGGKHGLAKV